LGVHPDGPILLLRDNNKEKDVRNSIIAATLAATLGLVALPCSVAKAADLADVRVVVSSDDLVFEAGVPYYKATREPVYVVYEDNSPKYYRVVSKSTYKGESVPPPWAPAYGWRMREGKLYHGHYDANGVWHWD
jgi:hypothetical protein